MMIIFDFYRSVTFGSVAKYKRMRDQETILCNDLRITLPQNAKTHSERMFSGLLRLERPCFCALGSLMPRTFARGYWSPFSGPVRLGLQNQLWQCSI
jgi:hypothetical protein